MPITWTGVLYVEGDTEADATGDRRLIAPGAFTFPDLPIPLRYQDADWGDHDGAVVVGTIDRIWREGRLVHGSGTFDEHSPRALDAARQAKKKIKAGISIDPRSVTRTVAAFTADGDPIDLSLLSGPDDLPPGATVYSKILSGRLRSATIVDIPAFEEARITDVQVDGLQMDVPGLTAAAMSHDGAMVALVPAPDDAARLAVEGYEPADVLHLTMFFLGDAAEHDATSRDRVEAVVREVADTLSVRAPLTGSAWASASFNPDRDPAATYLVGGDDVTDAHSLIVQSLHDTEFGDRAQHTPWIPHVTIGYGDLDPASLTEFGDVTFDRIRVAFGEDDVRDIELASDPVPADDDDTTVPADGDLAIADPVDDDTPRKRKSRRSIAEPISDFTTLPAASTTLIAAAIPPHSTKAVAGEWDGDAVERALPTGEAKEFYANYYAYLNDEAGDGTAKDHWHYLHHYREPDSTKAGAASVTACRSIIGLLNGARAVDVKAKGGDRQTVYNHMARHMIDAGEEPPELEVSVQTASAAPAAPQEGSSMTSAFTLDGDPAINPTLDDDCNLATLTASSAPITIPRLPSDHFTPFDLIEPTPLTVTDSGQVFGHVALDRICHVGMPKCVTMPKSATGLRYFHTGVVRLDDDTDVPTGRITMRGAHAGVDASWRSAMAHYDDVTTAIADVVAVEDDHGIAVFGHIRPGTDPNLVHAFRASTPSGDWRGIGHSAELINIHMVNSPGFPVYRVEEGRLAATIAASAMPARYLPGDIPASVIASAGGAVHPSPSAPDETRIAQKVIELLAVNAEIDAAYADISQHAADPIDDIFRRTFPADPTPTP